MTHGFKCWHDKAEEARASADRMLDGLAKETMLDIAKNYDRMAKLAAEHEARLPNKMPPHSN